MNENMNEGFGGAGWLLIILFFLISMNGGSFGGNNNATQQEILSGQKFDALSRQINQVGDGLASSTFALNNTITQGNAAVTGSVTTEGRAIQAQLCETNAAIHAEGEKTRELLQANKIAALEQQVAQLQMSQAMAGVVKYPMASTYSSGTNPFCGCGCY